MCLATLELLSRRFWPPPAIAHAINDVLRPPAPYVMFTADRCSHCDSRDKPIPLHKTAGHRRIFILGGSTVFEGDPSIPELIQATLSRTIGTHIEVYNFGVVSQKSSQELAHIIYHVADLSPDVIVMYDGGNDIMDPVVGDARPGYPFNFALYERNPLLIGNVEDYPAFRLFLFGSVIARHVLRDYFMSSMLDLDQTQEEVRYKTEPWRQEIARIYAGNLRKAHLFSKAIESDFVTFFQPTIYFKRTLTQAEYEVEGREDRDDPNSTVFHALETREMIRDEISQLRKTIPIDVVDVSDVFDNTPEDIFEDYIHVNRRGNEIIAARLTEDLVHRLKGSR